MSSGVSHRDGPTVSESTKRSPARADCHWPVSLADAATAPSVWHSEPYPSRAAAVKAGKEAIIDNIDRLAPVSGAVVKAEFRQLRKEIQGELEQGLLF